MLKAELPIKSVGTELTEAEYGRLEAAAKASGPRLAEWVREVLLANIPTSTLEGEFWTVSNDKAFIFNISLLLA